MGRSSISNRLSALFNTLTIVLFLTLIWLPILDHFFHLDHAQTPVENRAPAQWPRFNGIAQSREFIAGVEAYYNDHFGFRKQLVRWNNHWKRQLFKDAIDHDVLIGRDGWLFYSGERMFEHWTRQMTWSPADLRHWCQLLEMRRDWLQKRGIKYVFVVPPDKQTVYPEEMPAWMGRSTKPSKIQQLVQYMKAHSTVAVLDLTQVLVDAKKARPTYLKTDTHWNLFGAFVGCRAVMETLSHQMPELKPLPMDAYRWQHTPRRGGDLALMMGLRDSYTETEAYEPVPTQPLPSLELQYDPSRFPSKSPKESWPCFTINPLQKGKALLFRDSFARGWYPFLGQHFHEVLYISPTDWNRALIEREKPDVVIDEIVERGFNLRDPVAMERHDVRSGSD